MAIVVFNPATFKLIYPEFVTYADARCVAMFDLAGGTLLDNTDNSPVMDMTTRANLFYLLVAHLLTLFGANGLAPGNGPPPGRLSTATQGSVTAGFEYNIPVGSMIAPWFLQTSYGAFFWAATAPYRSARYYANGASGIGTALAYGAPFYNVPGDIL